MNSNILKPTKITPLVLSKKNKDTYKITKPKPYVPSIISKYKPHKYHKYHKPTPSNYHIEPIYMPPTPPIPPKLPTPPIPPIPTIHDPNHEYHFIEPPSGHGPGPPIPHIHYPPTKGGSDSGFSPPLYKRKVSKKYKRNLDLYKPYKIQIKSAGKWLNIKTPKKLNYYSAWNRASSIVDTYKERSFRLLPSLGIATKIAKNYSMRKKRFYQPAKTKGLLNAFIEKSKYAINTSAELKGITYKGILAKKEKNKNQIGVLNEK